MKTNKLSKGVAPGSLRPTTPLPASKAAPTTAGEIDSPSDFTQLRAAAEAAPVYTAVSTRLETGAAHWSAHDSTASEGSSAEIARRVKELLPEERQIVTSVMESAGFQTLANTDRRLVLYLLTGPTIPYSGEARRFAKTLLESGSSQLVVDGETQRAQFKALLQEQQYLPYHAATLSRPRAAAAISQVSEGTPTQYAFRNGLAEGLAYEVQIGDDVIQVFVEKYADPTRQPCSLADLVKSLAEMPDEYRSELKCVQLEGFTNPQDAYWRMQFNMPNFESLLAANPLASTIALFPLEQGHDQTSMAACLVHEVGHFISSRVFGSSANDSRWSQWEAAIAADGFAPSQYAKLNAQEDFSEFLVVCHLMNDGSDETELRRLMPARMRLFDTILRHSPTPEDSR
jgi:hypothetical protein